MVRHGWAVVCLAVVGAVAVAEELTTLNVKAGTTREVALGDLSRVSVSDPTIAEITVSKEGTLVLIGVSAGETRLITFDKKGGRAGYKIVVEGPPTVAAPAPKVEPAAPPVSMASSEEVAKMTMKRGTQRVLSLPGLKRVSVGDPAIADVRHIGGGQLLLIGVSAGTTTLLTWSGDEKALHTEVTVRD